MKSSKLFCALLFFIGNGVPIISSSDQVNAAEFITINLQTSDGTVLPDDKWIVYTTHIGKPQEYKLQPGINIMFKNYARNKNIEVTIFFQTGGEIIILKTDFQKFDKESEENNLFDVSLDIDPQGKILKLPNGTRTVTMPFKIKIKYSGKTKESDWIGTESTSETPPVTKNETKTPKLEKLPCSGVNHSDTTAQTTFCDALELTEDLEDNTISETILIKYKIIEPIAKDVIVDSVFLATINNPVIKILLRDGIRIKKHTVDSMRQPPPGAQNLASPSLASGIVSPEIALAGVSTFVAKRFKEELQVNVFDQFQKALTEQEELQHLFPATYGLLGGDMFQPWDYNHFLGVLRAAFQKDLDELPTGLKAMLEHLKAEGKIVAQDDFEAYHTTLLALDFIEAVRRSQYPADVIIAAFNRLTFTQEKSSYYANTLSLLVGISESLRESPQGNWIHPEALDNLLTRPLAVAVFAGLMLEESHFAQARFEGQTIKELLKDLKREQLVKVIGYYQRVLDALRNIETQKRELVEIKKSGKKLGFDDYYPYLNASVALLENTFELHDLTAGKIKVAINEKYIPIIKNVLSMINSLEQKKYAGVLVNALYIMQKTLPDTIKDHKGKLVKSGALEKITKYGTFMVNMVSAENADQIAEVLESVALPVGSHRIKKVNTFNVGLNAYAGGAFGYEHFNKPDSLSSKWSRVLAFSAPIGLALSWGDARCIPGKSLSVFVSIVDLGALTSYRLQSDKGFPEFEAKNLLAPGFYLAIGFSGPFALGLGAQHGPELRKIEVKTMSTQTNASAWRLGVFLSVDIPILNFYSSGRD